MGLKYYVFQRPDEAEIPFLEGSKIKVRRPVADQVRLWRQEAKEKGIKDAAEIGDYVLERFIVGLVGFENADSGKPLEFTDQVRAAVWVDMMKNAEAMEAFLTFEAGNLGNLRAGLNAATIGAGSPENATDASELKPKNT